MALTKENFEHLEILDLLINIWIYNDLNHSKTNCFISKKYEQFCIESVKKSLIYEFLLKKIR